MGTAGRHGRETKRQLATEVTDTLRAQHVRYLCPLWQRFLSLNPDSDLAKLMAQFPHAGKLEWIGIRAARRATVTSLDQVDAIAGYGLAGDHYASKSNGKRQVTLIQSEHLEAVAKILGKSEVRADGLRRNLLVSGLNIYALRNRKFRIGSVLLEGNGPCEPCSRMEEVLGVGGYNAMRGHGGITARILEGGVLRVGESLEPL